MIKYPFTIRDITSPHVLKLMSKISDAFREGNRPTHDRPLLLEEFGSWVIQRDWVDESGYYLTYRVAPLDARRADVRRRSQEAEDRWNEIFPGALKRWREVVDELDPASKVTLFVQDSIHSIGD